MVAFLLQQNWVVATETVAHKAKGFAFWSFIETCLLSLMALAFSLLSGSAPSPWFLSCFQWVTGPVKLHLGTGSCARCSCRLCPWISVEWSPPISQPKLTLSTSPKRNFRTRRDQPFMVKLSLYSDDNVETLGGWGDCLWSRVPGMVIRVHSGLLDLVPVLFHGYHVAVHPYVPERKETWAFSRECSLPSSFLPCVTISDWPQKDDLCSEEKSC